MKFSTTAILVTALLASSAEAANRHAGTRRTPTPAVAPSVDEARSAAILQRRALSADYVDVGPHHVAPRRRMKVVRRNSADKQQQQQPQRRVAAFGAIPVVGAGTQPIVGLVQRDVDRHDGKQGSSYTGNADWTDTATATATATDAEVDLAQQSGSQSHSSGSGSGSGSWGTKSWGSGSGSWSKGSGSGSYATATAVAASSANDDDSAEATATAVASSTSTDDDDDDDDEDCDDDDDDDDDEDCDDDDDEDEDDDDSSDSTATAAATGTATAAVEDAAYGSWGGKSWSKTASYAQVTDSQSGSSASASASSTASADGTTYTGIATWFTQNGVAGACGTVHADSDKVIALYTSVYGSGGNCGRTVSITNLDNGESTTATVADECPTCGGAQDIDLSIGTFSAIDSNYASDGTRNIEWYFTS